MRGARHLDDRGTATIEFAILLPVLMLIIVGTLEWGRFFTRRESIIHAAREGARGGTLLDATREDACAAATASLGAAGIAASCDGGGISVQMAHEIEGESRPIPAIQCVIDVPFQSLTGLPLALPDHIRAAALMPTWRPPEEG